MWFSKHEACNLVQTALNLTLKKSASYFVVDVVLLNLEWHGAIREISFDSLCWRLIESSPCMFRTIFLVLNNTGSLLVTVTSGQVTVSRAFCKFRDLVTFREERGLHIQNASLCLSYSDQTPTNQEWDEEIIYHTKFCGRQKFCYSCLLKIAHNRHRSSFPALGYHLFLL